MDADHHLEERQLEMIRCWPDTDHPGLMEYVESLWRMGDWGWKQQRNPFTRQVASRTYQVSTGGWSGNEVIINALEANRFFWEQCWLSYRVGGHYEFQVRMARPSLPAGARKALLGKIKKTETSSFCWLLGTQPLEKKFSQRQTSCHGSIVRIVIERIQTRAAPHRMKFGAMAEHRAAAG